MAPKAVTRMSLGNAWGQQYKSALDAEEWGQQVEAREIYIRLSSLMSEEVASGVCSPSMTQKETETVEKLAICFRLRANELKKRQSDGISLENMKALKSVVDALFKQAKKFPLDLTSVDSDDLRKAKGDLGLGQGGDEIQDVGSARAQQQGTSPSSRSRDCDVEALETVSDDSSEASHALTVTVSRSVGKGSVDETVKKGRLVKLRLDKIGFKDEKLSLVDPVMSAYWVSTNRMSGVQIDSKGSVGKDGKYFTFGGEVLTMQSTLESIIPGSALIFEFKHFKKEKNKMSTKCWAFLDRSEVTNGEHVLELYKKPVDLKRKKLSLFTVKPLYLHLDVELYDQSKPAPVTKKMAFGGPEATPDAQ